MGRPAEGPRDISTAREGGITKNLFKMAISKSFFGIRTGSTKSHTYQRYRNQQVTKDRVTSVANPQTSAQMKQRMQLVYIGQLAAALKGVVDHSFEGVEEGYKSIAAFKRINLLEANSPSYTLLSPKGYKNISIGGAIVANGSLTDTFSIASIENNTQLLISGAKIPYVSSLDGTTINTARALTSSEITQILNTFGWGDNMQVSLLLQYIPTIQATEYQDGYYTYPTSFCIGRFVFDPNDPAKLTAKGYNDENKTYLVLNDSKGLFSITWGTTYFDCEIVAPDLGDAKCVVAAAIIFSKKVDGVYKRNRANFVVNKHLSSQMITDNVTTDAGVLGSSWAVATQTYIKGSNKSNKYLNEGSDNVGSVAEV